jgi:signal transduction histidine kinase
MEYRVIAADGRAVWFRESLTIADEGQDRPRVLRGCLWDIGRRKKVERQLYTDRRKLAEHLSDVWHLYLLGGQLLATFELGPVLEEILSAVTALQGAEMGALRLLDADRDELETIVSLGLPEEYLERFGRLPVGKLACGLAIRRGGPVAVEDVEAEGEAEVVKGLAEAARLGGFRACFSVLLVSRRGDPLGTIVTFFREPHRPSERQFHLVEQYILQAADALDNARRHQAVRDENRRKEEFLATLAHELRNPLAAIQTCAHLIGDEALKVVSHEEVRDVIVRQAGYMNRLVEDLMDVSRVSRGAMELRKKPVDLADVVNRAVERVRQQVTDCEHELVVSLPEEPLRLVADPTRLEQVLANLLTNACKYTDRGGRIDLIAAREGDEVIIRVRDTGIGLAPEALSGLFTLFTQVEANHERSGGGLGIGLSLVKSLVELHGGSISARSDGPGHGSEFVVRLPI